MIIKLVTTLLLVATTGIVNSQVPSPSATQSQPGTVLPIQCLGCIAVSSIQIPVSTSSFRTPTIGDFISLNSNKDIRATEFIDNSGGKLYRDAVITIDDLNQNPLILDSSNNILDWSRLVDVGVSGQIGTAIWNTRAIGIYTRQGQPWSTLVLPNGVCKGSIIRIAKQLLTGGDNKPLAAYLGIKGYTGSIVPQISSEAGSNTLPKSHPLICMGELVDADSYYKDLVDKQLQEIIKDLASRTSTEKMRTLMQEVLRAYLKDFDKEIVESTARFVVDEMIKRGLVLPSIPTKPLAPSNPKGLPK